MGMSLPGSIMGRIPYSMKMIEAHVIGEGRLPYVQLKGKIPMRDYKNRKIEGGFYPPGYTLYARVPFSDSNETTDFKIMTQVPAKSKYKAGIAIRYKNKWLMYFTRGSIKRRPALARDGENTRRFLAVISDEPWNVALENLTSSERDIIKAKQEEEESNKAPGTPSYLGQAELYRDAFEKMQHDLQVIRVKQGYLTDQENFAIAMKYGNLARPANYFYKNTARDVFVINEDHYPVNPPLMNGNFWTGVTYETFHKLLNKKEIGPLSLSYDKDNNVCIPVSAYEQESGSFENNVGYNNFKVLRFIDSILGGGQFSESGSKNLQRLVAEANAAAKQRRDPLTQGAMYPHLKLDSGQISDPRIMQALNELLIGTVQSHRSNNNQAPDNIKNMWERILMQSENALATLRNIDPVKTREIMDIEKDQLNKLTPDFDKLAQVLFQATRNYKTADELSSFDKEFGGSYINYAQSREGAEKDWAIVKIYESTKGGKKGSLKFGILVSKLDPNFDDLITDIKGQYKNVGEIRRGRDFAPDKSEEAGPISRGRVVPSGLYSGHIVDNISQAFDFNSWQMARNLKQAHPQLSVGQYEFPDTLSIKFFRSDESPGKSQLGGTFEAISGGEAIPSATLVRHLQAYEDPNSKLDPIDRAKLRTIFMPRGNEAVYAAEEYSPLIHPRAKDVELHKKYSRRMGHIALALNKVAQIANFGKALNEAMPSGVMIDGKLYKFDDAGVVYRVPNEAPDDVNRWRVVPERIFDTTSPYWNVMSRISELIRGGTATSAHALVLDHSTDTPFTVAGQADFLKWYGELSKQVADSISSDPEFNEKMNALLAFPTLGVATSQMDKEHRVAMLLSYAINYKGKEDPAHYKQFVNQINAAATTFGEEPLIAGRQASKNFATFVKWVQASYLTKIGETATMRGEPVEHILSDANAELIDQIEAIKNLEQELAGKLDKRITEEIAKRPETYSDAYIDYMAEKKGGLFWKAKEAVLDATLRPLTRFILDFWDELYGVGKVLWDITWNFPQFLYETKAIAAECGLAATKVFFKTFVGRVIDEKFDDKSHIITVNGVPRSASFRYVRAGMKKFVEGVWGTRVYNENERRRVVELAGGQAYTETMENLFAQNWLGKYAVKFSDRFDAKITDIADFSTIRILGKESKPGNGRPSQRFVIDIPIKNTSRAFGFHAAEILGDIDDKMLVTGGSVIVDNTQSVNKAPIDNASPIVRQWWIDTGQKFKPIQLLSSNEDVDTGGPNSHRPLNFRMVKLTKDSFDQVHLRFSGSIMKNWDNPKKVEHFVYGKYLNVKGNETRAKYEDVTRINTVRNEESFSKQDKMNLVERLMGVK